MSSKLIKKITKELEGYEIPEWIKVAMIGSPICPRKMRPREDQIFRRIFEASRIDPTSAAIIMLLTMITYQDLRIQDLENEIILLKKKKIRKEDKA